MSRDTIILCSQPGGRGRLMPISGGTYEGTYQLPNGKYDRRRFKEPSTAKAVRAYKQWCAGMDAELLAAMEEKAGIGRQAGKKRQMPVRANSEKGEKVMAVANEKGNSGIIYVVQVVGGVCVTYCDTFDKAASVCDALTISAKASGFAAKYDVVEVKKWTV